MNSKTNNKNENVEKKEEIKKEETQLNLNKKYLRPISQITQNIYLGNIYDAQNIDKLIKLGIQKVLSLITDEYLLSYPPTIEHKFIKISDFPRENIIKYFGECLLFINDDKKVLVHCFAGSSRSATIIIAYLMWKNQLNFIDSCNLLQKIRPIIYPNYGFVRQLKMFEKLLKKNKYNISIPPLPPLRSAATAQQLRTRPRRRPAGPPQGLRGSRQRGRIVLCSAKRKQQRVSTSWVPFFYCSACQVSLFPIVFGYE